MSDHDLLIEIKTATKNIIKRLDKINGKIEKNEDDLNQCQEKKAARLADHAARIISLEQRPSATRAILTMTGLMGVLLTISTLILKLT